MEPVAEVGEKPIRQAEKFSTGAGINRRVGCRKIRFRSLNLLQRLRRHGLLVPSMKKAAA